jgi:hypothetical protein
VTVIFCDRGTTEKANLQGEIKRFYESNYQTDEIYVIGGEYCEGMLDILFVKDHMEVFKDIPKLQRDHLSKSLHVFIFNKDGILHCINKPDEIDTAITDTIIRDGLINIFKKRGGLIEAKGRAHHFVFPSGKHCNKFLRTGNILLHSCETYFIAFTLLSKFKEGTHKQIFCDTSSINTLAFALLELKRKLVGDSFNIVPVESFSSYEGIFSKSVRFYPNSLILISSSTSGNILDKINQHHADVDRENMVILFYLGKDADYLRNKQSIICNLTNSKSNPTGIQYYDTYTEKDCEHCKEGSYPVEVKGDVFLLEKPNINRVTIKVTDAPKKLSEFIGQFKSQKDATDSILKVNYKETYVASNKYEVYFDIYNVFSDIDNKAYKKYKDRLFDFINQYIPSKTKYLITLPDEGSEKLAELIINHVKTEYKETTLPEIVKFDDVTTKLTDTKTEGAVVIVASCISNGKNLLYLSRTLRPYDKLRLIYFVGLTRTCTEEYLSLLKSNLKQGIYGKESNSFVEIDNMYCNKDVKGTSWLAEEDFVKELLEYIDQSLLPVATEILNKRLDLIAESLSTRKKGLRNELFFQNTAKEELMLRKGFAFFNFTDYSTVVSQGDVYFTISAVINNLRNNNDHSHCLRQTEFVRNIIDPHNFNRFNDGVIQACILRAAYPAELAYHIDYDLSNDMKGILEKIIEKHDTPQGEGLIEFLYAIASEKLTLKKEHLTELCNELDEINHIEIVSVFNDYIKMNILSDKPSLHEQIQKLKEQVTELTAKLAEETKS